MINKILFSLICDAYDRIDFVFYFLSVYERGKFAVILNDL